MDISSYNHSVTGVHDSTGVFDYPDSPGTSSSYKEELVEDLSESVELFNQTSTLSSEKVSTIHYAFMVGLGIGPYSKCFVFIRVS